MEKRAELTRLALVHMVTGFVMFLGMGLLGYAMRLEQAGFWSFNPALFYEILTLHGAGMLNAALILAIGGMIEALNGTTPMNTSYLVAAYLIFVVSFPIIIVATLIGGVGAGWTMLYPLPYHSLGEWSNAAAAAVYAAYFLTAAGFFIYCVVFLAGTIRAAGGFGRALALAYLFSGGRRGDDRLPSPSQLAATAVSIDGIGTVILGCIWLIPRFLSAGDVIGPMDPLFVKGVLNGFGHMITNLAMYTALASLFAMLPIMTGRELKTSIPIVLALDLVILILIVPFGHHLYQDFAMPKSMLIISEFASAASTIPVLLVAIMGGLVLIYRSAMRWSVPAILVVLGLWGWAFGGVAGLMDSVIPINQVTHNTLWVPGHFHTYYLLGVLAFTIAYMYHLIRGPSGKDSIVSRIAAWLYGIGGAGFVLMFMLSGAMSVPRRFAVHIPAWRAPDQISVGFVGLISLALLWLGSEIFFRLFIKAWRS